MKRSLYAATTYAVLGLLAGLFYREFTKANEFPADQFSQLNVLHTHLFALGMLMFLIVLGLDAVFNLSAERSFTAFFWSYNGGVALTTTMMVVHGTMTVTGTPEDQISPAISGIAGLGHIITTLGIAMLFMALFPAVNKKIAARQAA